MNICIKYCGGCNPKYDRKTIVDKLKEDFVDINIISNFDKKICDYAVVIAGCTSACVNHDNIHGRYGKFVIKNTLDYDNLSETLAKVFKKKNN